MLLNTRNRAVIRDRLIPMHNARPYAVGMKSMEVCKCSLWGCGEGGGQSGECGWSARGYEAVAYRGGLGFCDIYVIGVKLGFDVNLSFWCVAGRGERRCDGVAYRG